MTKRNPTVTVQVPIGLRQETKLMRTHLYDSIKTAQHQRKKTEDLISTAQIIQDKIETKVGSQLYVAI